MEERLYGRKKETESLEAILHSVLKKNEVLLSSLPVEASVGDERLHPVKERIVHSGNDDSPTSWKNHRRWNCQFVLVSGPEGSGKRAFARSVLKKNLGPELPLLVCFGSGRFHPFHLQEINATPFSGFDEALQEILNVSMKNSGMMTAIWQRTLQTLEADEIEILRNVFPSVKRWLLEAATTHSSKALTDAKHSMESITPVLKPVLLGPVLMAQQSRVVCPVLIRFLQSLANVLPVVLLLEDFQYADEASLYLVEELMNRNDGCSEEDKDSKGLLIVATSRVAGIDRNGSNALTTFLKHCKDKQALSDSDSIMSKSTVSSVLNQVQIMECMPTSKTPIGNRCFHQISLPDLTWDEVFDWVRAAPGEVFRLCSIQQKREIADLAFHHSSGNPLRLRYCLLFLGCDESVLNESEFIHKRSVPKSICELYSRILSKQDAEVQNVVRVAAALAQHSEANVHCDILEVATGSPCIDALILAHNCGLLEYAPVRGYVRFSHMELLKVAFDGIPTSNRALLHLDIGRRVWRSALENRKEAHEEENIDKVLLATLQLRNSIHLLVDFEERLYMAQLCFEAGQKSSLSGDFLTAAKLFEFATSVLGNALWRLDLYETSLVLHNAAAQAYYSIGDFTKMEITLDSIFDHATSFRDKLSAFVILVYGYGTRLKQVEGYRTACVVLRELGEPVHQNPGTLTILAHLVGTKAVLLGKSDLFYRTLAVADDADFHVVSQFIGFGMFNAYVVDQNASVLLCLRLIRLSLKKGVTGASAVAFISYGFMLSSIGSFEEGYRYGRLACELVVKFEEWRPRVHYLFYGYTFYWLHPFRDCEVPLQQAQHAAFKYGDLEVYAGSIGWYLHVKLMIGSSLRTLLSSARSHCCSLDLFGQKNAIIFALPILGMICDLMNEKEPLNMSCEIKDAGAALKYAVQAENSYTVGHIYSLRTMLYYLIGDYSEALLMAKKSAEYRQGSDHILTFYEALASLALAWTVGRWSRRKFRNRGLMLSKRMKGWARRCPDNFLNKQLLLEAEAAALNGNSSKAIALFEQSIHKAKQESFLHEEGIAYERLGRYQLHLEQTSNAMMSFESARAAFENWGATALVNRMENLIQSL
jgi:predicted ATPase